MHSCFRHWPLDHTECLPSFGRNGGCCLERCFCRVIFLWENCNHLETKKSSIMQLINISAAAAAICERSLNCEAKFQWTQWPLCYFRAYWFSFFVTVRCLFFSRKVTYNFWNGCIVVNHCLPRCELPNKRLPSPFNSEITRWATLSLLFVLHAA